jgi:O-antigen/teichoic acid export membrane protein
MRKLFGNASPLVLARLASAVLTFGLPLALVRLLDPTAFGSYKQFFLVGQTVLLVGQLGLTQSLFYFLPRGGADRGSYVAHALLERVILGALAGAGLALFVPGELHALRVPLGVYAAAMLAASPLEGALTSERRIGGAAIAYVVTDAVRAAALIAAAPFGLAAIARAAAVVALLRCAALTLLVVRDVLPLARPHASMLRAQLAYALPFAAAMWLYVGQRYFAQFAVSIEFDPATFALYSIAAFHLPVVDIVFTPISEVLMVQLSSTLGHDRRAALHHWDDAVRKLATLLFPATAGAFLLGPSLLPILFTQKFAAAVPLFLLATCEIPLWILPLDGCLRAAGDTRFMFWLNAGRVVLTAATVLVGMKLFGLAGAIGGQIVSEAIARSAMLVRTRRFLGDAPLCDWPALARIAAAAAAACLPAWIVHRLVPGLHGVLAAMGAYGIAYLLCSTHARRLVPVGAVRGQPVS